MPKFESSAARPLPQHEKPKLTVIEGGKGKPKSVERWSADEVLKPNMPKPRQHGAEAPVDMAALMREEQQKVDDIRRRIEALQMPKPTGPGPAGERWSADEVLKPNMPKPRQHGAEAPVDIAGIMRSDAELAAAAPEKPKVVLPKPRGMEEPIELSDEDLEEVVEEAPPSKKPPRRPPAPPAPRYREAA